MILSKSGFMIEDLFTELKGCMSRHDYEKACHISIELACSGQMGRLVSFLIGLISSDYVSTNAWLVHVICTRLQAMEEKKYSCKAHVVRRNLVEIVVLLAQQEQEHNEFYQKETQHTGFVNGLHFQSARHFPELEDGLGTHITKRVDVWFMLPHLYDFMLQGNIKSALKVVYALCNKNSVPECETIDIVFKTVKKNKDDAVWILWKVLLIFASRPPSAPNMITYIQSCFNIFATQYNRKDRQFRLNLLFVCYVLAVRRKEIGWADVGNDIAERAGQMVDVIYDEIIKPAAVAKSADDHDDNADPMRRAKSVSMPKPKSKPKAKVPKSTLTPEQKADMDSKMKYLFVITYHNENTSVVYPKKSSAPLLPTPVKSIRVKNESGLHDSKSDQHNHNSAYVIEKV